MVKLGENKFAIEMAVAGFSRDDISVTQNGGKLVVKGQQEKNGEDKAAVTYLHHGISARSFHREFLLADHVFVKGATLENGMLTVTLEVELPEELKPAPLRFLMGRLTSISKRNQAGVHHAAPASQNRGQTA